jgi:hypothetical protein
VRALCLYKMSIGYQGPFPRLCLCPAKSRFPTTETGVGGDSVRMLDQSDGKPSTLCCLGHSAGKSMRRAMPIPCRSRPSMAALTRSGARKASEIVNGQRRAPRSRAGRITRCQPSMAALPTWFAPSVQKIGQAPGLLTVLRSHCLRSSSMALIPNGLNKWACLCPGREVFG